MTDADFAHLRHLAANVAENATIYALPAAILRELLAAYETQLADKQADGMSGRGA